jgi:hypothetical protein
VSVVASEHRSCESHHIPPLVLSGTAGLPWAYRLAWAEMMVMGAIVGIVLLILIVGLAILAVLRSVRIVPQARAGVVERLGRYHRTLHPGLNLLTPFIDRVRPFIDLREQVVSFPPQPVITKDNLVVGIDTVIYFQVTDPRAATYEIANYVAAVEQLTVTTLRNVVGGMDLETTLTSRWSSRRSSRPSRSRARWRSRCAPIGTSAPRSCPPRVPSSRPS